MLKVLEPFDRYIWYSLIKSKHVIVRMRFLYFVGFSENKPFFMGENCFCYMKTPECTLVLKSKFKGTLFLV